VSEYHKASEQSTGLNEHFLSLKEALKDGLLSLCTAAGIAALHLLMEEEITKGAGPKGKHDPHREAYRHGYETSSVKINGVNSPVTRPRARTLNGREIEVESFELARTKSCCAK